MSKTLVKHYMTTPVITTDSGASLVDAHRLMSDNQIRRLPVVDDGKLIGIISLNDVLEAKPSTASSLSVWELNYQIANLTVKDIMSHSVITLSPESSIAEAAKIMLEKKFSGIPVAEGDTLKGIVTESDIFRMLASA